MVVIVVMASSLLWVCPPVHTVDRLWLTHYNDCNHKMTCPGCSLGFAPASANYNHYNDCNDYNHYNDCKHKMTCPGCPLGLGSASADYNHYNDCNHKMRCPVCPLGSRRARPVEDHGAEREGAFAGLRHKPCRPRLSSKSSDHDMGPQKRS